MKSIRKFLYENRWLFLASFVLSLLGHAFFISRQIFQGMSLVSPADQYTQMLKFKDFLYREFTAGNFFYSSQFNGGSSFFTRLSYYYSTSIFFYITCLVTRGLELLHMVDVDLLYWARSILTISYIRLFLIIFCTTKLMETLGVRRKIALLATLFFAFSGIYFQYVYLWEFFADTFLWIALIFWGAERVLHGHSPSVFILGLALSLSNNAYFAYKNILGAGIYILLRIIFMSSTWREKGRIIMRFFLAGIMASLIALPGLITFITGIRENSRLIPNVSPLGAFTLNLSLEKLAKHFYTDGELVLPWLLLILLLIPWLYRNKSFRLLSILSILSVLAFHTPLVNSIFNGFNYPITRWVYIAYLIFAMTIAVGLETICQGLDKKNIWQKRLKMQIIMAILLTFALAYYFYQYLEVDVSFFAAYRNNGLQLIPQWTAIFLSLLLFLSSLFLFWKKSLFKYSLLSLLVVFAYLSLLQNNFYMEKRYKLDTWSEQTFIENFALEDEEKDALDYIKTRILPYQRLDYKWPESNNALLNDVNQYMLYSSFQNKYQQYFERMFEVLNTTDSNNIMYGFYNRSILNRLHLTDYFLRPKTDTQTLPFAYEKAYENAKYIVYKNQYPLTFLHPVKHLYEAPSSLNTSDVHDLGLIDGAYVPLENVEQAAKESPQASLLDFTVEVENGSYENGILTVSKNNKLSIKPKYDGQSFDRLQVVFDLKPLSKNMRHVYTVQGTRYTLTSEDRIYGSQRYNRQIELLPEGSIDFQFLHKDEYQYRLEIKSLQGLNFDTLIARSKADAKLDYDLVFEDGHIKFSYDNTDESQWMVLPIMYEKGWKLQVNGKEEAIIPTNGGMIGFPIPSGKVEAELLFHQAYIVPTSIISGLAILGLIFWQLRRRRDQVLSSENKTLESGKQA